MKTYHRLAALLLALLVLGALFVSCTKEETTNEPSSPLGNESPIASEESPTPPQLDFEEEGSMPVFEW